MDNNKTSHGSLVLVELPNNLGVGKLSKGGEPGGVSPGDNFPTPPVDVGQDGAQAGDTWAAMGTAERVKARAGKWNAGRHDPDSFAAFRARVSVDVYERMKRAGRTPEQCHARALAVCSHRKVVDAWEAGSTSGSVAGWHRAAGWV